MFQHVGIDRGLLHERGQGHGRRRRDVDNEHGHSGWPREAEHDQEERGGASATATAARGSGGDSRASVSVAVGNRAAVWRAGVAYAPNGCRSAGDCDDGDACSFDACVKVWIYGGGEEEVGRRFHQLEFSFVKKP